MKRHIVTETIHVDVTIKGHKDYDGIVSKELYGVKERVCGYITYGINEVLKDVKKRIEEAKEVEISEVYFVEEFDIEEEEVEKE